MCAATKRSRRWRRKAASPCIWRWRRGATAWFPPGTAGLPTLRLTCALVAETGEISGEMLRSLGCTDVLVGHSERRQHHGETDDLVNAKVQTALRHGLTPILCVGEELDVRELNGQIDHCNGLLFVDRVSGAHAIYQRKVYL